MEYTVQKSYDDGTLVTMTSNSARVFYKYFREISLITSNIETYVRLDAIYYVYRSTFGSRIGQLTVKPDELLLSIFEVSYNPQKEQMLNWQKELDIK